MTTEVTRLADIQSEHAALVERAGHLSITSADENEIAAQMLREVKGIRVRLDEERKQITRPLDEAKARVMDAWKEADKPYAEAEQHLKGLMHAFVIEERARVARETAEAEARMARAFEEGRVTDAEVEMADIATIPEIARPPAGTGLTARWKGEVVDVMALCRAVLEGALPPQVIKPNQVVVNGFARDQRVPGTFHGIRVSRDESISVSAR